MIPRQPYQGSNRKLVLAFDVGTTYSGVSYCILDPGEVPQILTVTRYPAQENVGGNSKIPTILYYDKQGKAQAIGAETLKGSVMEQAIDNEWTRVEWFKLHLRPTQDDWVELDSDDQIPPLPPNKTAVEILADFMRYLYGCTRTFIQQTHGLQGADILASFDGHVDFILTHPNGWGGPQQSQIRHAAVLGGLIPDTYAGHSRVHFVTEGEASLHFCVGNGLVTDVINSGKGIIIVDAGGGTVDMSAYTKSSSSFEEIAPSECLFHGSIYVTRRAQTFIENKLQRSTFGNPDDIRVIVERFDRTTKLGFASDQEPAYVKFGTTRDKDPRVDIRLGQLKLQGSDVAAFFEPSVKAIIKGIERQKRAAHKAISVVFLVGGFAASDWLFSRLQLYCQAQGLFLYRPDSHLNKAVAHGAVSFCVDHLVSVRVAKYSYGTGCLRRYDKTNPEHKARSKDVSKDVTGNLVLHNGFDTILPKGTSVSESREFKGFYIRESAQPDFANICTDITCYRGSLPSPRWIDTDPGLFATLCTIEADTSKMLNGIETHHTPSGSVYYVQRFSIVLLFGLTELKAQIAWMENGKEKRSPATVIYDGVIMPTRIGGTNNQSH